MPVTLDLAVLHETFDLHHVDVVLAGGVLHDLLIAGRLQEGERNLFGTKLAAASGPPPRDAFVRTIEGSVRPWLPGLPRKLVRRLAHDLRRAARDAATDAGLLSVSHHEALRYVTWRTWEDADTRRTQHRLEALALAAQAEAAGVPGAPPEDVAILRLLAASGNFGKVVPRDATGQRFWADVSQKGRLADADVVAGAVRSVVRSREAEKRRPVDQGSSSSG